MNPIVMQQVATGAKKVFSNKYVLIVIAILVGYLFFRKKFRNYFKKKREAEFDRNEHKDVNQLAQQYRSASNPSGVSWMIDFDGTDEEAIERLAYQTKGVFSSVADAYKLKFDETLTDRMRNELSSDDLQNWRNIIE